MVAVFCDGRSLFVRTVTMLITLRIYEFFRTTIMSKRHCDDVKCHCNRVEAPVERVLSAGG